MGELNDRDEGGLFSDDYDIPKRENPYKKKKKTDVVEDRAAAYVKSEDKPSEKRENPYVRRKQTPPAAPSAREDSDSTHPQKSLKDRWDDFIFAHVKLICFIGGVIFLLLFISAPAIYYGIQDAREQAEQEAKDPLTLNYVKGLADKSEPISWSDLVAFPYDESVALDSVTWMIPVQDTHYEVWISGVSTRNLPTYVYLYDMRTGDKVDLTKGLAELEQFLLGRE